MNIRNISEKSAIAFSSRIVKCSDLTEKMADLMQDKLEEISREFDQELDNQDLGIFCNGHEWTGDGLECEVLQPGSMDWQKGKVRISISYAFEFITDPATGDVQQSDTKESSLDQIRQMLT